MPTSSIPAVHPSPPHRHHDGDDDSDGQSRTGFEKLGPGDTNPIHFLKEGIFSLTSAYLSVILKAT